jgi:aminoglycoside 6-adenylyltransferase
MSETTSSEENTAAATMQLLESRIISWAESQANIRAILVVGSRARRDFPADEWSDIDLMVFTTDFEPYLNGDEWLDTIGEHWLNLAYETGDGDPERIVRFDGQRKADFVFLTIDNLQSMVESGKLDGVYHRGYCVLIDKDGLAAELPPPPFKPPPCERPSKHTFTLAVNWFWHGAVYVAQQIRRRNLWVVKYRDWTMKEILLRMLEWHARSEHGWGYDTWHDGHFLSEWADPEAWNDLHNTFGRFDAADSWQALLATMDLFRRLATETASRISYTYPATIDERFTQLVERLYTEDVQEP